MSGNAVRPKPPNAAQLYPRGSAVDEKDLRVDPYPTYETLLAEEPVSWIAQLEMWWVVSYDHVVEILKDDHTFTTASPHSTIFDTVGAQMLSLDGAAHDRPKRATLPSFQPRPLRVRLEAQIAAWVDELIDGFDGNAVDLRASFAARLPVRTMLGLFGLPLDAEPALRGWYDLFEAALANFRRDPRIRSEAAAAVDALHALLQTGIEAARQSPASGLLAELAAASEQHGLGDEEIRRNASIIMFGGISTVEGLILNALWALAMHPAVDRRVRSDPNLIPQLLEEVLRWQPPVQSATRHVVRDLHFHGHAFRAGDTVNCMLAAANRDPAFLTDARLFNIDRVPAPRHLSFAIGPHFCLGLHLARLQAKLALERLYARLPDLVVATPERFSPRGYEFRQPEHLPVSGLQGRLAPAWSERTTE
jgi:cytochrome P450